MSTANRPLLVSGDRLTQPEFHARYEQMPPGVRAKLIGGVVYVEGDGNMPSPTSDSHGDTTGLAASWLGSYRLRTPGVRLAENVTTILDDLGQAQPDCTLRILSACGGRTRNVGLYFHGAPELIVEVAVASRAQDLGPQLADYERSQAPEYIVFAHQPDETYWHILEEGRLRHIDPDPDGIYRSRIFPGLWLDPAAFWAEDVSALLRALEGGLNSPEHAAFVARLRESSGCTPH